MHIRIANNKNKFITIIDELPDYHETSDTYEEARNKAVKTCKNEIQKMHTNNIEPKQPAKHIKIGFAA